MEKDIMKVFDVNKNTRLKRHYTDSYGVTRIW